MSGNCKASPRRPCQTEGVNYDKRDKLYRARITKDGKRTWLGYFKNPRDAAEAYNKAATEHFEEFARLNAL